MSSKEPRLGLDLCDLVVHRTGAGPFAPTRRSVSCEREKLDHDRRFKSLAATAALTIFMVAASAWAAVDATGKWSWNQPSQGGNEVPVSLELKQEGESYGDDEPRRE